MKPEKKQIWLLTLPAIVLFVALPLKAQVTVGKDSVPHSFSILELATDIEKGGLRLPQFTTEGRESSLTPQLTDSLAEGLTIFNSETNCLEFWNGTRWVSLCDDVVFDPAKYEAGSGCLTGISCFDVLKTEGSPNVPGRGYLSWRKKTSFNTYQDFTQPVTYTFTPATPVSKVRFAYVDETGAIVESLTPDNIDDATGTNISASCSASLHFKTTATAVATGLTQVNALKVDIYAIYNDMPDGSGTDNTVKLTATIKDGGCCGAYSVTSDNNCKVWTNFMCHNLGADETLDPFTYVEGNADGSGGTLGYMYQWGRTSDGHQLVNSAVVAGPLAAALANSFIDNEITPFDWLSVPNDKLWNSGTEAVPAKTSNDPCPSGWRVPTQTEWVNIFNGVISSDAFDPSAATANTWTPAATGTWSSTNGGGYLIGDALYLPASGYRVHGGNMVGISSLGIYWSNTPTGTGLVSTLNFNSSGVNTSSASSRGNGRNVRCIAQ